MYRKAIGTITFVFGASLPLFTKLGNISLAVLMLLMLIGIIKERRDLAVKPLTKQLFLSTVVVFFVILYGLLFTQDLPKGVNMLGRSFSYLVLPVLLFFVNRDLISLIKNMALRGIVFGCSIASILLLGNNFIKYFKAKGGFVIDQDLFNYYHTYLEFASMLNMHPTYIGMYFLIALSALIFVKLPLNKNVLRFVGLLFLLTIIFLNSRTVLMLAGCLLVVVLVRILKKIYYRSIACFLGTVVIMILFIVGSLFLLKDTYMYSRVTKELQWELTENVNSQYNNKFAADSRLSRWMVTMDLIKERPILGYGTGSGEEILNQAYGDAGLSNSANSSYDTHNQYLHITLEYGLIGLLLFLFYLIGNFIISIRNKNWDALVFFSMLLFCSLFENIFKFNAGIIFIAFFSNIYMYLNTKE